MSGIWKNTELKLDDIVAPKNVIGLTWMTREQHRGLLFHVREDIDFRNVNITSIQGLLDQN